MRLPFAGTRLVWPRYHAGFGVVLLCQSILALAAAPSSTESIDDTCRRFTILMRVGLETGWVHTHTTHTHTLTQAELAAFGARLACLTKASHLGGACCHQQCPGSPTRDRNRHNAGTRGSFCRDLAGCHHVRSRDEHTSFENNQSRSSRTRGRFRLNQVHRHFFYLLTQ